LGAANDKPSNWRTIAILGLLSLVLMVALACLVLPTSIEAPRDQPMQWMPMASVLGTALLSPLHALWINRHGALRLLRLALSALIVLGLLGAYAPCLAAALIERLFFGIAAGLVIAAALHLARQLGARRYQAVSLTALAKHGFILLAIGSPITGTTLAISPGCYLLLLPALLLTLPFERRLKASQVR
jgi:cyanate permease